MLKAKKRLFGIYIILVISMVAFKWYNFMQETEITQPLKFNHQIHSELADCDECHKYFEKSSFAGVPDIYDCMECHEDEPETDSPEEDELFEYIDNDKDISWIRLYKTPVHVYFSHKRHVSVGKLECEKCHGHIGSTTEPPGKALVNIDMDRCIACHKKDNVEADCATCHR